MGSAPGMLRCLNTRGCRVPTGAHRLYLLKVTVVSGKRLSFMVFFNFLGHVIRQADRHIR
jgi:hypothetical protein